MSRTLFLGILIYYMIAFIMLEIASLHSKWKKYRIYAKTAASLGFVVMALIAGRTCSAQEYAKCMSAGFGLCMVGDIQLAMTGANGIKQYMKEGLISFLMGHILFVVGLYKLGTFSPYSLLFPIFYVGLLVVLVRRLRIHLGKMKYPVMIYVFFVSLLFSTGLFTWIGMEQAAGALLILSGTAFFIISDTLLFFLYFYHGAKHRLQFTETLTYYLAQMLLACSLLVI